MNFMASHQHGEQISSAEEIIEEARAGRCFILVDDESRENEGDIVIPAQFATRDVVNFMARYARGLICLALTPQRVSHLKLSAMAQSNDAGLQTAFTLSIEARTGVTTGISAADRARTIAVAINPESRPDDIVTPGHIFPLIAREGGTLVRAGHTEAAVDVSRIAGLNPSGVICEVMNEDGSMARLPDLLKFARQHNMKLGTIADLIAYRLRNERLVKPVAWSWIHHPSFGEWRLVVYRDTVEGGEHVVLIKGEVDARLEDADPEPVAVCLHRSDFISDVILAREGDGLHSAMFKIMRRGRGVIVMVNDSRTNALSNRIRNLSPHSRPDPQFREYGIGAQILVDIGVREMVLLSGREQTLVGIEGYGLTVVEQEPLS
ncbi:3,4-dihydroxy-2-butanone-4-phosphate synthase [Hyphomicrobium sp. D-2]|uniref:3,4-dihydroxy-2-butanone-4-phosphate synthase n=1 Tax=Hyphomicrobium sp. D-2 TaxID=3041621 RepID=UPI002456117D|nr:3,4-dihydroxy-2-butanone-4-phosphate synthase [Hyphomicrobium sp. D-2]MDH4981211.1 3,4-dihydroxy-2-butanone-4-phosphate synthase [Hyphomicrobium sp. D-2]